MAHYTRGELLGIFQSRGFTWETSRSILGSEVIMVFRRKGDGGRLPP
jgi:hypothetical protein